MALPILPILLAMPAAARIIHDIFGENKEDAHTQQMRALLKMAEGRLAEMQAQLVEAEKRCAVAEAISTEKQAQLDACGKRCAVAEARLDESRKAAEARLGEARKKRGWWPWSRR